MKLQIRLQGTVWECKTQKVANRKLLWNSTDKEQQNWYHIEIKQYPNFVS